MSAPSTPAAPSLRAFLVRGGTWAAAARGAALLTALAAHALVARLLPPDDVGRYLLLASVVLVARTAGQLGLGRTLVRRLGEVDDGALARTRPMVATTVALAAVGGLAVALLIGSFPGARLVASLGADVSPTVLRWTALWSFVLVLEGILAEAFRGLRRVGHAVWLNGLASSALLVLLLAIAYGSSGRQHAIDLSGVLVTAVSAVALSCALGFALLAHHLRHEEPLAAPPWQALLTPSLPILATTLLAMVIDTLGLWLLGAVHHDQEQLALYGTAHRMVRLVGVPLLVVNAVLPPVIARLSARGDRAALTAALRLSATVTAAVGLSIALALTVAGRPIAGALFGAFYAQAAPLIVVLALGQLVAVASGSCGLLLLLTGHQREHLRINLFTLCALPVLGVPLAYGYGAFGMAFAFVAATAVQQVGYLVAARRHTGIWAAASLDLPRVRGYWRALAAG